MENEVSRYTGPEGWREKTSLEMRESGKTRESPVPWREREREKEPPFRQGDSLKSFRMKQRKEKRNGV